MTDTMSTHQSELPARPPRGEASGTISCLICQAVYTPSQMHAYLLQAPPVAFESAFMSMCHFCFRCRRPACPGCWDDVHSVCGMCTLEAQLPFRSATTPLRGVLFPPARQAQVRHTQQPNTNRFVCIHPGRFQHASDPLAPIDTATTVPIQAMIPHPPRLQQSVQRGPVSSSAVAVRARPARVNVDEIATQPEQSDAPSLFQRIENTFTTLLLIALIIVLLLIISAEFSMQANLLIANILHVDIRAEITYLLQLISDLHL